MIILSITPLGCFKWSTDQYHKCVGTSGVSSHCYKPNVRNHQQKEQDESLEISFRVIPIRKRSDVNWAPPPPAVPLTPSSLRSVHTPDMLIRQGFQLITSKEPGMVNCN